jgi:nucleotidyltransferase substrate binding protein (TIGR01987 family)
VELCWKALKAFLKTQEGIDEASPKKVTKAFYLAGYLCEDDYLLLIQAVDDRNRLSHVYDEQGFRDIFEKLPSYSELFDRITHQLAANWTK